MKLHHLRDFLAIVEKGSIGAAAKHLGIAQPALSRSIRELEADVGVPLFERHARGSEMTSFGKSFSRRASAALGELRKGRDELDQMKGLSVGSVTACISGMAHITMLSNALRPFRVRYPQVHLKLEEAVYPLAEGRLRDGAIDVYAGPIPESGVPHGLHCETLFQASRVVLVRKGHPLAGATSLSELVDAEWLTTSVTDRAETEFGLVFEQHGLPAPRLAMRTTSSLSLMAALLHTDVIAITMPHWAQWGPMRDRLVVVNVRERIPAPTTVLMYRAAVPPTPAAEYLCDMLRRAAGYYTATGQLPE